MNFSRKFPAILGLFLSAGVLSALAQQAAPAGAGLDDRSVLVEWSEEKQSVAEKPSGDAAEADELKAELEARIEEAMAGMGRGMSEEALVIFQQVLREDPQNKRARFGIGTAYIQMNNYREALAVLEPMTEEFPDDFSVKNNVAWLYATARDLSVRNGAKAIRFAQEALLINPHSYQVWNTLSESYFITGEYERAQRAAEEALKLALQQNAPESSVMDYRRQAEKSRRAARAMSLLE